MKNKTGNLLPKMAAHGGTVHRQFVRCGKASCKCARGKLHGAYYYYFVRINGRLKKRYLKADQVEPMRAACAFRQKEDKTRREHSQQNRQMIREMNSRFHLLLQQLKAINRG
ncbi:MAG TPA: DUF6788 family protein [Pyrinomonadaceae bacterium]|jgi:hypothetical protein